MYEHLKKGTVCHGFILKEKKLIREIGSWCYYFSHAGTGARLLRVVTDDPNKTFCIGFKTYPDSDNGVPHILEHSVLNGSKNFPVKSPFDILQKGSLNTFLNAFTSKDFTMYPVASMNERDYFHLMHVYLDAVFNPLIYDEPGIMKQEGWHHELTDKDGRISFNGVVYNEMLGAFSNPRRELWYQTYKHLYPGGQYGWESGGTPEGITTLSREKFLEFHRKFYHPSNSYIFLYGDAPLEDELQFIHEKYLSHFGQEEPIADPEEFLPFGNTHHVREWYQYLGESTEDQTFLSYNFTAGRNTDHLLTFALDILCEIVVNQESAPVRLALAAAGIGKDVSAGSANFFQHTVQIVAMNASEEDLPRFLQILRETFENVATIGIDREEIEGILNRMEFRLREGEDAQKGLALLNMALPGWFFANDPFTGLEYETLLAEIRNAVEKGYLEQTIFRYFLNNPHTLILTLAPSLTLEQERSSRTREKLETLRQGLSPAEIENLVSETQDLARYQQREDPPEALASVPLLSLHDINRKTIFYEAESAVVKNIPMLYFPQQTHGVVYLDLIFDMEVIRPEDLPWMSLMISLSGSLSTENYPYGKLNRELNTHTGGFSAASRIFLHRNEDHKMLPRVVVSSKAMTGKMSKMFSLTGEILSRTLYNDPIRMATLIKRHHAQLEARFKGSGYQVAATRFGSYLSRHGALKELITGLTYYDFIKSLLPLSDQCPEEIMEKLKSTAGLLFSRRNLTVAVSGASADRKPVTEGLDSILSVMPDRDPQPEIWTFPAPVTNEGILTASNVQYVVKGGNYLKAGYQWDGKMMVLNQVLTTDWLQKRIRVMGGAYGGFASISPSGTICFSSYRDPNLRATLEAFSDTPAYLASFDADPRMMTRYIIGTISDLDTPLTPGQKADRAFQHFITGKTAEMAQNERDAVLSTTGADIRGFSEMVNDIVNQQIHCVYGHADTLKKESKLFNRLVELE